MNASDVVELLDYLEDEEIDVWLNGGWGVDALLGRQTRDHHDLDITISIADRQRFTEVMEAAGFRTYRVDNKYNWVLVDADERLVDVHLVDLSRTIKAGSGLRMYGPDGLPFEVGSLDGLGSIEGRPVKCETAESQVQGHIGYEPDEGDYQDVLALCQAFGLELPKIFEDRGFDRRSQ